MPEPDPQAIAPGTSGPLSLEVSYFLCGNKKHRTDRAKRILHNLRWKREWCCPECGGYVPFTKRADATYCRESCRKKAARRRRVKREAQLSIT